MQRNRKWLRNIVVMFLAVGLLLSASGCSSEPEPTEPVATKKNFVTAMSGDPGTADTQMDTSEYLLPLNIYDRLVEVETVGEGLSEIVPGLAETWSVKDDMIYTFNLRKGVKFHNGEELKADDVVYTFDRMLNPETKALNTDFLDMIAGAQDRLDGKADSTSGLKALDDYTVEITLETPFAPFLAGLAVPGVSIYNRKATVEAGPDFGQHPIGTGPFKLTKWEYNSEIVLEAFEDYWNGRAPLDMITIKIIPDPETQRMMFETAELDMFDLDMAPSQIPYFKDNPTWADHIVSGPRVGTYYYSMNVAMAPLDKLEIRQAIQYAIDRELLLETLYFGTGVPAKGVLGKGLAGYNPDLPGYEYNPDKARALVVEAGYPDGVDLEIWQTVDSPNTLKLNEAVQAMLADVGIRATIVQQDSAAFMGTRKEGQVPMYHSSWSADFNDPDNFLYTFFGADNSKGRSFNYNRAEVKQILEDCRTITDPDERYSLYQDAEYMVVYEDCVWVPLFHMDHLFVVQPWVKNFKVSWNGWSSMSYYGIDLDMSLKQ